MKKITAFVGCLFFTLGLYAQQPEIQFAYNHQKERTTSKSRNYISGKTCKTCKLTVNKMPVKVYPTGAFALQLDLEEGDSIFLFKSVNPSGKTAEKQLIYTYRKPEPEKEVDDFRIASVEMTPEEKSWLMPGDRIEIKIKAQPGNKVQINDEFPAFELPKNQTGGIGGIYQYSHLIKPHDTLFQKAIKITMENLEKKKVSRSLNPQIKVLDTDIPVIGETKGRVPYFEFGLGTDRLGGAKINYLDTAVLLHINGKMGNQYRVSLAPNHTAYIPVENVRLLPQGAFIPHSLTGSWMVNGDEKYDYVAIGLSQKLPYTTFQKTDPSRIVVDIYGATANTNWITQLKSAKEIENVYYEQKSDGVLRVTISLKHQQQWGYAIYYEKNRLTIRVKRQPEKLKLSHLTIAVDAGHGGRSLGALGATGAMEKDITLLIAKKLQKLLLASGTKVYMTRKTDVTSATVDRMLKLRELDPDLLISIHCNSSGNPIDVKGTSTYYRYIGFRPLSQAILNRMLDLGLQNFGNIGRFNFSLNGPTEYPNALVETLFISNPEDEMNGLDSEFQKKIANAIKTGIEDFLLQAKEK